jgi:two-component system cell cycle sensor histidine kinase/response regulator CckA
MPQGLTAERRTDRSTPAAAALLPALLSAVPMAVIGVDLEGRVTLWNPAAERIFGWSEDDVLGRALSIVPDDLRAEFLSTIDMVGRGVPVPDQLTRRRRRDGAIVEVNVASSAVLDSGDRVVGLLSVVSDISDRHSIELELQGAQRMEAVGRLAGGVAHDFNNILTAIIGYSDLLAMDLPADDPKRADIAEIRRAADRATRLTRQLLAFGRREAQQICVLDMNDVVAGVLPMLRQLIGSHIELVTSVGADLGRIRGDAGQLEQVIVNLVLNARDAMPAGGRLAVTTADVDLDQSFARSHRGARSGQFVRLVVEDTGMGMDASTKAHLFEPYFTTKEPGRGTGLGLATVYGIIKQSGGAIFADSELGRGTTMSVYLPRIRD